MQHRTMAVGIFRDPRDVRDALGALKQAGFEKDEIGLAVLQAPDAEGADIPEADLHRIRVDETTGILAGGVLGGVAGWLIGAATGGIVGYLVDRGLSHEEAQYYHERVRHGAALVTVHVAADRADEIRTIVHRHGGHDFHTRPAS